MKFRITGYGSAAFAEEKKGNTTNRTTVKKTKNIFLQKMFVSGLRLSSIKNSCLAWKHIIAQ
jgi:hypothetical protein